MEETNLNQPGAVNPNNNIVRNWLAGIAGVLIVLIAITYMIHRNDNHNASTIASDTSSSTAIDTSTSTATVSATTVSTAFTPLHGTLMTASQGEAIAASDQPAGESVDITSMTLSRESWVAVETMDGSILGAALFPMDAVGGTVPLERATVAGEKYEVVIYADKTGKSFDFKQDLLVMGTDGSPVGATFTAQ